MSFLKIAPLALFAICAFAADEATKLPASVQVLLDKAEKDGAAARRQYDAAIDKITQDAAKPIKVELDKLTKAGKLEEAMAVKKLLDGLRQTVVASVDEAAKVKGDLMVERKFLKSAKFGIGKVWHDCLPEITAMVKGNTLEFTYSDEFDKTLYVKYGDPAPGFVESIVIEYFNGGSLVKITVPPRGKCSIP